MPNSAFFPGFSSKAQPGRRDDRDESVRRARTDFGKNREFALSTRAGLYIRREVVEALCNDSELGLDTVI
jgi:hypothetical protein